MNYGIVKYVDWDRDHANQVHLVNPIEYTFSKAMRFSGERKLRVALSAPGVGHFLLNDGRTIAFPASVRVQFDFFAATAEGTGSAGLVRARRRLSSFVR